jgi:hypothetical protein
MALLCAFILVADQFNNIKAKKTIKKQEFEMRENAKELIKKATFSK